MPTDAELLRAYAEEKSEPAFGELVRRHVNLVYSVALRQCGGDAHLAEDVAQRVFTDLARKARQLAGHAVLGGWLYRSAQFAASDVVRAERRRRAREQEASAMQKISDPAAGDADWQKLAPVLDQAIGELAAPDRDAVVLRFFESRPFAEIGATLRLTEDAARMRVDRALEKLRAALARRGITSTSAALGVALANQVAATVPAGVAASVISAALAGNATAATAAGAVAAFVLMAKKISVGVLVCLAVLMSGFAFYESKRIDALKGQIAQLRMDNLPVNPRKASLAPATAIAATQPPAVQATAPESAAPRVITQLTNAGRATPAATFETFNWAMGAGDTKMLADAVAYDDEGKAVFQKVFSELSSEAQTFFGTPEIMAAAIGASIQKIPMSSLEILEAKPHGPDAVMLNYRRNGDGVVRFIPLVQMDGGWKVVGRGSIFQDRSRQQELKSLAEDIASRPKK